MIKIKLKTGICQGVEPQPVKSLSQSRFNLHTYSASFYMTLQFDQPAVDYPTAKPTFLKLKSFYKRPTNVIAIASDCLSHRTKDGLAFTAGGRYREAVGRHPENDRISIAAVFQPPSPWIIERLPVSRTCTHKINLNAVKVPVKLRDPLLPLMRLGSGE